MYHFIAADSIFYHNNTENPKYTSIVVRCMGTWLAITKLLYELIFNGIHRQKNMMEAGKKEEEDKNNKE